MNKKCGLYTRVSTHQQLENDYNSIETQKEQLLAYCQSKNLEVYKVYEDGGFSASSMERPALHQMINDIITGKINSVIVYKIDRLARSMKDFYKLFDIFEEYNVEFISISQNFDTSNSIGRLSLNMVMGFAQFEREMISDRIRDKMHQRASKGFWNGRRTPYGYKLENKQLVIHPEQSQVVEFMYRTYADNPSLARLREQLHQKGWYNSKGKEWTKPSIHGILKNKVYTGLIKCNDHYYEGIHEPIISEELYEKVQVKIPHRSHQKTKSNRVYLLKGLLRCKTCGSYLTPHYTQKRNADGTPNRIPYYRCTKKAHHEYKACPLKGINANKIENEIIKYLFKLTKNTQLDSIVNSLNKDLSKQIKPLQKEEKRIKKQIADFESEISRFLDALGSGDLPVSRVQSAINEREGKIEKLQKEIQFIQEDINNSYLVEYNADGLKKELQHFSTIFDHLTSKEKFEALQCMIKDIEVDSDKYVLNLYEIQNVSASSQKRLFWWS